jgi:hypothetical protein
MKETDVKKVGAVAAAAAGLMMIAAPAAMADGGHGGGHHWKNGPLVSALNANNLNGVIGACGNNVGVFGGAVPINSPSITETCAAGGISDGNDLGHEG